MKISTTGKISRFAGRSGGTKNVTGLNIWGGAANNENARAIKGVGGKAPDDYGSDLSNEQIAAGRKFKGFSPNRGSIDYTKGGDRSANENPRGFKQ